MSSPAMLGAGFLSVVSTIFLIVVLISSNPTNGVAKHLNWEHGFTHGNNVYIGVWETYIQESNGNSQAESYDASECTAHHCSHCDHSMKAVIAFVAMGFAFSLPSIVTNFMRGTESGNTYFNKYVGVFTSFIVFIFSIITVIVFSAGCGRFVKDDLSPYSIHWRYGPAWILMMVTLLMKAGEFLVNLFTPEFSS